MKSTRILAIALMAMLAFAACKDKEDDPAPAKTKKEMLTTGKWKATVLTIVLDSAGTKTTYNGFDDMDECDKDDLIIYNSNGTVTNDEGATKCDPADPQTYDAGTWEFQNNETQIKLVDGSSTQVGDILELSESTLKLTMKETFLDMTWTITATFSH